MSVGRFLLLFSAVLLSCIGYTFILPLIIELQPQLAFLQGTFDGLIYLGEFLGGAAFLYAGAFSPDITIDKFRRSSLFRTSPALRRRVTRVSFFLFGLALIVLSLASFSVMFS